MSEQYDITEERIIGTEVDNGNGRVRPIWKTIQIRIPDGEIPSEEWDDKTWMEKRTFLYGDGE